MDSKDAFDFGVLQDARLSQPALAERRDGDRRVFQKLRSPPRLDDDLFDGFAVFVVGGVRPGTGYGEPGGVGGIQFGIEYDAPLVVQSWNNCTGGNEIPSDDWPSSGSGNAITKSRLSGQSSSTRSR